MAVGSQGISSSLKNSHQFFTRTVLGAISSMEVGRIYFYIDLVKDYKIWNVLEPRFTRFIQHFSLYICSIGSACLLLYVHNGFIETYSTGPQNVQMYVYMNYLQNLFENAHEHFQWRNNIHLIIKHSRLAYRQFKASQ